MTSEANSRSPAGEGGFLHRVIGRLAGIEDGTILRAAFFTMLAGTAGVLFIDYRELSAFAGASDSFQPVPILPPATRDAEGGHARPEITTDQTVLEAPLTIELGSGGVLRLTGTIDPGAAQRFAEEIEQRGEYVTAVLLDSPGGAVDDALEIGRLIRERGLNTEVENGGLCASSCPIIFASGQERLAGRVAAIGVHQVYAAALAGSSLDALNIAGVAMADAQAVTARITRHLSEGGVDPALWLHALETPPDRMYYLSPEEMERFALVTSWEES